MEAKPLSKKIHDKAKEHGITQITLAFSGGSDEGYLRVETEPKYNSEFAQEVEDWAWEAYSYSGAGDGSDYGDNIVYDLKNGKVSTNEWYQVTREEEYETYDLETE